MLLNERWRGYRHRSRLEDSQQTGDRGIGVAGRKPAVVRHYALRVVAALPARSVVVFLLVLMFAAMLSLPVSASAVLPEIEVNHMSEIEEWVYRNGALTKDPLTCGEVCGKLWLAEGKGFPKTIKAQEFWDELGALETSGTELWGPLSKLQSEIGWSAPVTTSPIQVGWHIDGGSGGTGDKWMDLVGPEAQHVPNAPGWCVEPGAGIRPLGYIMNPTAHQKLGLTSESWVMQCFAHENLIAEYGSETIGNCKAGGNVFGDLESAGGGWKRVEWWWNDEYCGIGPLGEELLSKTMAVGYTAAFHFSEPQDWTGQKVEGPGTRNVETNQASDPGVTAVKTATEYALENSYPLSRWVQWVLEGEHGANPLATSPEEEYGSGSGSAPNKPKCMTGKPVNCATGNEVETQTDLSVGGRGPGLHLTRTYNAQLAATQSAPGPFGYGWTGSYSAHVEVGEASQVATVYQDDGSTARFLRSGEQWVAANPLVQAKLAAAEGGGYLYTLPNQTVLRFDSSGRLSSETDRNGNALTMARNGEGRLESVTDPAGRKLSFAYNGEGLIESVKDPMGHTVKYAHESGNLASVTLPGEESPRWQFKYDASHRLTKATDGRGGTTTNEYDSSNRVISQTDPLEHTTSFEYRASETKITNKATGAVTRETFSAANEPLSVTRGYGTAAATTEEFGYDTAGDRTSTTDGNKHTTKFGYDTEGNRTSVLDAAEHETKWTYDSTHDAISMTTPKGETTTIKRDSHGNPETIERPAPESKTQITKYKYTSHGELESVTNPLERIWKYEYDSKGDRTAETDPEGNKRTWGYNEDSQETSTVSPRGNVTGGEPAVFTTTIERDAQGRPLTVIQPPREPANNSSFGSSGTGNGQFQFPTLEALTSSGSLWVSDSSLDRLQKFNEKGEYVAQFGSKGTEAGQFKFPFGIAINPSTGNMYVSDYENYRVQEFSSSGTFIRMFGYGVSNGKSEFEICTEKCQAGLKGSGNSGQFGNPDGVAIDSSGNVWVADETNNRLEEYAENGTFIKQFGTKGTEAGQIKQPVGLAYDHGNLYVAEAGNQRVQEFTTAGVYVTKFGSEGTGNGQFKIPYAIAAGPSTNDLYVTDRENNRVEVFTSAGVFLSSFGSKGKGSYQMELPTGLVANTSETLYVSDHGNRRVDNWTGLTARITKYAYDAAGNLEARTDPNANKTKYTYNADNEQTKTEAANGTITETEYDGAGQIVAQTDANKHTTKYVRNALEEVIEVIDPLARKTTKEYDPAGNLTTVTDPAKRTTTYTYDAANRLTEVKYSDGKTPTVKYEYDKDNDRTGVTDGTGTTTYTYDQLDRLTEAKDGHGDITKYEYDLANQQTGITYPNGKTVTRTYDKDGRLEKITDWSSNTTKFAYNPDSNLTSTTFPGASTNEDVYTYNNSDEMSEVKMLKGTETLASLIYARDANSQVNTTINKGLPGSEITEAAYDANNRLTKNASTTYEYDSANNPTKIGTGTYKYDNASELETGPSTTYTYDELGERTKTKPTTGQTTTYSYDQAQNLTTIERPKEGEKAEIKDTYAYNGEDLRTSQTISGTTSYLSWDMTTGLPLILSDETNSYIYGPGGLPVEQISSGGTILYLHHDQQGSTRLLTSSTGAKEASFTYDAYGNTTGTTGTAKTPLGYDAQYTSSDTGLVYLRARTYDPATAQFLTIDPMVGITRAPYNYTGDSPLTRGDASGLSSWNPFSESFWTEGNVISESPLNPIPYYEKEIESYENGCGYFASVTHGLEGALAGAALFAGGEGEGALAEEGGAAIEAEITGFTRHGLAQAISREGVGVNEQAMLDAVNAPVSVETRANGTTRFVGKDATVVLNGEGRVVSTWANSGAGRRIQP
jgi:RHS repeat-associated protein